MSYCLRGGTGLWKKNRAETPITGRAFWLFLDPSCQGDSEPESVVSSPRSVTFFTELHYSLAQKTQYTIVVHFGK